MLIIAKVCKQIEKYHEENSKNNCSWVRDFYSNSSIRYRHLLGTTPNQIGIPIRITEIMYNPMGGDDYEFIELKNDGDTEVDLSNVSFEGITFSFPSGTILPAGEFIVLVQNPTAFAEKYPDVPVGGTYQARLSDKGEEIILKDRQGNVLISIPYDDENGGPVSPDGRGDSLVFIDLDGAPHDPRTWRARAGLHGSPGADDSARSRYE